MKSELTAVEAIGLAIRSEEDAADFYGKVSKMVKNELVKAKYVSLAKEEVGHRAILVNLYKKLTGENAPPRIPGDPKTAESGFPVAMTSMEEIFEFAISREQEAQAFYRRAASSTSDVSGKRTFEYLADIERGHELMLKMEYDAYKRDRDWYSNNPDIQLVGP